jgi:hypothetical protein
VAVVMTATCDLCSARAREFILVRGTYQQQAWAARVCRACSSAHAGPWVHPETRERYDFVLGAIRSAIPLTPPELRELEGAT